MLASDVVRVHIPSSPNLSNFYQIFFVQEPATVKNIHTSHRAQELKYVYIIYIYIFYIYKLYIYKHIYIYCHLWQFFRFQHWSRGQGVNLSSALFVTEVWSRLHVQSLWSAFMRPQKPTGWSFHPELVGWHGDMVGCHPTFLDGYVQCIFTASSLCFFCFFVCLKAQESFWPLSVAGELSSNFSCRTYTSQSCLVCPW